MKKLAVMQPYFLPYIGYFQLINHVDLYVFYDDVAYIKGGWINRTNILLNNSEHLITIPLKNASSFKMINEIEIIAKAITKILKTFQMTYHKAPYFDNVYPLIQSIMEYPEENCSLFVENSIIQICKFLDIKTEFIRSSDIDFDKTLKGQDRLIELCKVLGYENYVNNINGKDLYSKEDFQKENLNLYFFNREITPYKQFNDDFVPFLSIIDVLMFNDIEKIKTELNKGELI